MYILGLQLKNKCLQLSFQKNEYIYFTCIVLLDNFKNIHVFIYLVLLN